jgi:thymidylate synthase (FAD)
VRVTPVAVTKLYEPYDNEGTSAVSSYMKEDPNARSMDALGEFAGRACYESWHKPNPKTASNQGYMEHILEVGHFSILEHASISFYLQDVSRSLTHELVRHRHLSFSQRSQRYVDESRYNIVIPPDLADDPKAIHMLQALEARAHTVYKELFSRLRNGSKALDTKRARSAARAALLGSQSTGIVVTGNLRAWREVILKRDDPAADEEIQELAREVLVWCKHFAPNTFQDLDNPPVNP